MKRPAGYFSIGCVWLVTGVFGGDADGPSPEPEATAYFREDESATAATLFALVPPEASGLIADNPYDDPAMWGSRYASFQGGSVGSGVAVGDVDGDGWFDLFIARKTGPDKLFRQAGPLRFEEITASAGVGGDDGSWRTGASMADVDNDGDLDLFVCQVGAPNRLYLNDGQGRFTENATAAGLDLVSGSVVGAFADYDRDGDLDLFIPTNVMDADRHPDGEPDFLFRNNGDGTFTEVTASAGIAGNRGKAHAATWWDANNDDWPDLYVSNDFAAPDHLYRNNGDGTFTNIRETALPHTPWFSMGADAADINNDGLMDFLATDMAATTHFKQKVTMGDMGGLVDHMDTLPTPQYMKNALFLNSGTDRFLEVAKLTHLASTDWTWSPRFADFDNDGWEDLHVTNGMVRGFTDSDLLDKVKRLRSKVQEIALMRNSPPLNETNLAFRNHGGLHFESVGERWGLDHTGVSFGSAVADFDRDGDLDLVTVNHEENVSLYRNNLSGARAITVALRGRRSNRHGIGAKVLLYAGDQVRTRELRGVRGALSSSPPVAHFGLGNDARVSRLEIRWPSGHVQTLRGLAANHAYLVSEPPGPVAPEAAVRERRLDHALFRAESVARGLDFVSREAPFNDMIRQPLLPHRMNTLGGGAAWGDADGDGDPDLFLAGPAGQNGALYWNDGNGGFREDSYDQPWRRHGNSEDMAPLWLDIDGDGDLDLFVSSGGVEAEAGSSVYGDRLYLNDGRGGFVDAPAEDLESNSVSSSVVATADYDGDGDLDLFIGGRVIPGQYPRTPRSRLLQNRDGMLVDVTADQAPGLAEAGMVTSALWTDADGDGRIDLLVAAEWQSPKLYRNTGAGFVDASEAAGLSGHNGWWNALQGADVDSDGDIDYIAGNVGLNTKYHASADHPVRLFYGNFEDDGGFNIVEAKYEGDRLLPVRGLSCSSRAMPSVRRHFPTFREFGSALLEEIYTGEKLNGSLELHVNELASGVFLNDGTGRFTFAALPIEAQIAPVFGIAARDFDGDGNTDLLLAQNFHGPQVETGRYNGGLSLLLRGGSDGKFRADPPARSGVAIDGEARTATVADIDDDGWADILVTRVDDRPLVLMNRGTPGSEPLRVTLVGPTGNPGAAGARARIRYSDGVTRALEVYAGSGYLGQDVNTWFLAAGPTRSPVSIDVRWPDGVSTSHPISAGATALRILHPAESFQE